MNCKKTKFWDNLFVVNMRLRVIVVSDRLLQLYTSISIMILSTFTTLLLYY